jgi:hypothetical protein
MTASFEKIDYSLRPAKYAERRMLRDIFRRLSVFDNPEEYTYVGFGSVWFSDFIIFHRSLGVRKMLSIEKSVAAKGRIQDNLPFRIDLDFRHSNTALSKIKWGCRHFIWLDYDDPLRADMMADVRSVARSATSGSMLVVSAQCARAREFDQAEEEGPGGPTAFDRFLEMFSKAQVPPDVAPEDLVGSRFAELSRTMFIAEIEDAVAKRKPLPDGRRMSMKHVCSFEYGDGVPMTTIAVIFYSDDELPKLDQCQFTTLDFITKMGNLVRIETPKLTIREIRAIESQLPLDAGGQLDLGNIPAKEAQKFQGLYRYFPSFAVIEN